MGCEDFVSIPQLFSYKSCYKAIFRFMDQNMAFLSISEHIIYGLTVFGVPIFIDFLRNFRTKSRQNLDKNHGFLSMIFGIDPSVVS